MSIGSDEAVLYVDKLLDLRSAKTGDSTYDSTLPEGDWFDVENHPKGKFVSTKIEKKGDNYLTDSSTTLAWTQIQTLSGSAELST